MLCEVMGRHEPCLSTGRQVERTVASVEARMDSSLQNTQLGHSLSLQGDPLASPSAEIPGATTAVGLLVFLVGRLIRPGCCSRTLR
jgi:hypothetical protein